MSDTGPETGYRGPDIPDRLGRQIRRVLALDERPAVFGDWVEALARVAERDDFDLDMDALCTVEESPHEARFGGATRYYQCVQDPIIVPFLAADVDRVEIHTRSPERGEPVELTVTESSIESDPTDAVFSVGVDASAEGPPDDGVSPAFAYGLFCPYGHAFASSDEYKEWDERVDAFTMAVSMSDTYEWAQAMGSIAREPS